MPSIRGAHNGRAAIATVAIIDAAKYREHQESRAAILTGVAPFRALVDTGATSTMIATRVAAQIGLRQINKLPFMGLGGLSWRPGYLFHVAFYEHDPGDSSTPTTVHVCRKVINGGELTDEHTFDVLLGMDILTTGRLQIDKDGSFGFTF